MAKGVVNISVMRILICLLIFYCSLLGAKGQAMQQGRVKTLGRLNKPGEGLANVIVKIADQSNDLITNQQGAFSFYPKGKKFMLSRIRKNNYQLIDQSVIGRVFPFSVDVPMEIVMVSCQDLLRDKQHIEDKAYERAERNYKEKILDLEQQLKQHTISRIDAEKERIRIGESYQRYLNLIGQMAEHYATTDYDGISEKNKQILQCIENGDLERADSLLNSKGDFRQREAELQRQKQITQKAEELVNQSRLAFERKLNDLAQDYYNKHSILMGNYQNDSAAYYLERRAMLDTTRVEWMMEAGLFYNDYLADYGKAIGHFKKARSISAHFFGEKSMQVAMCDNLIGKSMIEQGRYTKAMENILEAKSILEELSQQATTELVECYANMANIYIHTEEHPYPYSQKALKRATELVKELYGEQDIAYEKILSLNAEVSAKMRWGYPAQTDILRAQEIIENKKGDSPMNRARNLYNIGIIMSNKDNEEKGLAYIQQALSIWKQMFGENHPYVSYAYGALADSYTKQKKIKEADNCYVKALNCQKQVFGESHPYIAECQLKLGRLYRKQGDYGTAASYGMKALDVMLQFDEYRENNVISLLQSVDSWLSMLKKVKKHSEEDIGNYYGELNRLVELYGASANKKVRLKNIKI